MVEEIYRSNRRHIHRMKRGERVHEDPAQEVVVSHAFSGQIWPVFCPPNETSEQFTALARLSSPSPLLP